MLVLLVRHAQAAEQDEAKYSDDTLRPLLPSGRRAQRRMSRLLLKQGLVPDRVFSSPWKRAWQTARTMMDEMGLPKSKRIRCDGLATAPDVAAIAAEIGEIGPEETIALVGHEPWTGELAARLLTGHSAGLRIDFAKSAVLAIEMERFADGGGTLRSFLVP